ncbi:hypothetical protein OsJ_18903 [Oryza sativa Japonica Group]|uniref:Uncharacterized protein n=1 Tax=Oryza sativa subsp. japonica TaxID=39947 RepID=B9FKR2_ORYSJ|nr:hypothetical protein OsJ_18903 [Oryza sativa Japonica Group]
MGNSLRCCLACMLPCGALDVVRVVHLSGRVDEFTSCPLTAADVLAAHPNHALTAAWSPGGAGAGGAPCRKIVIVSPDSELKRGRIYYLIPSDVLRARRRQDDDPPEEEEALPRQRQWQGRLRRRGEHRGAGQLPDGAAVREAGDEPPPAAQRRPRRCVAAAAGEHSGGAIRLARQLASEPPFDHFFSFFFFLFVSSPLDLPL